jgi:UPF0042 nucleotide-binding protein
MNTALAQVPRPTRVILVTGMSGAGKSSALKALEDLGYEAVDNIPISLIPNLVSGMRGPQHPLAIGVDIRTRDFAVAHFLGELGELVSHPELDVRVLFLDCQDGKLQQRYSETRRRHPLAADRPVMDGIRRERALVSPLQDRADVVLDTTDLTLGALGNALKGHFGLDEARGLSVFVTSFSYRHGVPREADLVFDVRFLKNPHYESDLSGLNGLDREVGSFIETDADFQSFFRSLVGLLKPLLPRFAQEGKSYLTIAIGCTGGKHRSVFVAEKLAQALRAEDTHVSVVHRDIKSAGE